MIKKAAGFGWVPEQEKVLQQVQAAVQAALRLGPHDPGDPLVLEVAVTAGVLSAASGRPLLVNHNAGP